MTLKRQSEHSGLRPDTSSLVLLKIYLISFVKRKANSTIEKQKCKSYEKRNRLLVLKTV